MSVHRHIDVEDTTAHLHCPICGTGLDLPVEHGVVMGRISCAGCKNRYLILITTRGELAITAELIE